MQHSPVFIKLLELLALFKEASLRLSALDNQTAHFELLNQSFKMLPEHKGAYFRTTAERYAKVIQQFSFVSLVCRRKIDAINEIILFAIETQNAIALAQGARSLIEHVAVHAEITRALEQFESQIKGQTEGAKIHDAISKAEVFLARCYFGKSPKIEVEQSKKALHIQDCIKTLDREASDFSDWYNFLCEFVHPNHGSNSLVSSVDLGNQINSILTDLNRPETQRMAEIVKSALLVGEQIAIRGHAFIAYLGEYEDRFKQPKSKISNIFAERKIKPIGDGKTKETALYFEGSRDEKETRELCHQYFENRKIQVLRRQLAAIEGDFAFDLYETTQGQIWQRIVIP